MEAEGGGCGGVGGAVVYEEGFGGGQVLLVKDALEDFRGGFHEDHVAAEVEVVEPVVHRMAVRELRAVGPGGDVGVGIGEEEEAVAAAAKLRQLVQVLLRKPLDETLPGILALSMRQLLANSLAKAGTELLAGNKSALQLAKKTILVERVQPSTGIGNAQSLKTADRLFCTKVEDHPAHIENDILNHRKKLFLNLLRRGGTLLPAVQRQLLHIAYLIPLIHNLIAHDSLNHILQRKYALEAAVLINYYADRLVL